VGESFGSGDVVDWIVVMGGLGLTEFLAQADIRGALGEMRGFFPFGFAQGQNDKQKATATATTTAKTKQQQLRSRG
jgi:hypothetical protein